MNEIPPTRQSLLLELGRRSDDAWAEFLAVYEDALHRYCRARRLQDADARDVVQDVLAAVLHRIPTWDHDADRGSFRGWLFRAARNIAVDAIARRAREVTAAGDTHVNRLLAEIPAGPEADQASFETEYRRSLFQRASQQVQAEVRPVTWQAFLLTAVEGRPAEEVAATLGVPIGSVYTAKCRVVARIRDRIAAIGDAAEPPDAAP